MLRRILLIAVPVVLVVWLGMMSSAPGQHGAGNRFQSDNAMGASANSLETVERLGWGALLLIAVIGWQLEGILCELRQGREKRETVRTASREVDHRVPPAPSPDPTSYPRTASIFSGDTGRKGAAQ